VRGALGGCETIETPRTGEPAALASIYRRWKIGVLWLSGVISACTVTTGKITRARLTYLLL